MAVHAPLLRALARRHATWLKYTRSNQGPDIYVLILQICKIQKWYRRTLIAGRGQLACGSGGVKLRVTATFVGELLIIASSHFL